MISEDAIEILKETYIHLAYVQQVLAILQRNATLLQQIEQQAEIQYSSGRGNQQDVLKAQLEQTKILREISMQHQSAGQDQATLKQILARPQDSADIVPEPPAATFLPYTANELLAKAPSQNPMSKRTQRRFSAIKLRSNLRRSSSGRTSISPINIRTPTKSFATLGAVQ